jgi:hypothetical protein
MASAAGEGRLARCHGFFVLAGGAPVGAIETPVFPGASSEPDFLLVRTEESISGTFRVVSTALVENVDPDERSVTLALDRAAVESLPEELPLTDR